MAIDINLNDVAGLVVQTAAEWAADSTVYSAQYILVTSDEVYSGTDQRKFKISNGTDTWDNLDYFPVGSVQSVTGDGVDNTDPANPVLSFPTPGEIGAQTALGFTPENVANKVGSIAASATEYPNNNAVIAYADAKVAQTITDGVTTSAPSQDAVYDMAIKKVSTIITLSSLALTRADSTTYFWGLVYGASPATAAGAAKFTFDKSDTLTNAVISVRAGNTPSNEASTLYLRHNNTTDHLITTIDYSGVTSTSNVVLNVTLAAPIAVVAGDIYEIKEVMQAMATNPTNAIVTVILKAYTN